MRPHQAAANLRRPVQSSGLAALKRDGSLAEFLKAVVLEPHLVIEPVRRAALAARQLRGKMAEEHIQPFKTDRAFGHSDWRIDPLHYLELIRRKVASFESVRPIRQWRDQWPTQYEAALERLRDRHGYSRGTREFRA